MTSHLAFDDSPSMIRARAKAHGDREAGMHRFFRWFFQNRETGAFTIGQAPNLSLWIIIVAGALIWVGHPPERLGVALATISKSLFSFGRATRSGGIGGRRKKRTFTGLTDLVLWS
jgi:hypothetical protein